MIGYGISLFGQNRITGQVADETGNHIPFAHVLLFQSGSQQLLKGVAADSSGRFDLLHSFTGELRAKVQALGFHDHVTADFSAAPSTHLGVITLRSQAEVLDEIVVTGEKPLFEHKIDRTIVNVQGSVTNIGNNVLNVLSKSPAVRINRTTNEISMMGKPGVIVMIDNKQIRLGPEELINLLQNMSSDNIETLELITAPPASYDAQGNAGIININTMKGKEGLSGQLSANVAYGKRPKFGGSLNLGYQKAKLSVNANLSSSVAYDLEKVSILTRNYNASSESDLWVVRKPRTGLHTADISVDYQLKKNTFIGAMFTAYRSNWEMTSTSTTQSLRNTKQSIFATRSYEENKLNRNVSNINFRHRFSPRTEVSVDIDAIQFTRNNPTQYEVSNLEGDSTSSFFSKAFTPVKVYVGKSDFKHKINDAFTMEAGIKGTVSDFRNKVSVAFEESGSLVDDPAFTDVFDMDESIYAAYTSANWQPVPSLTVKAGLRYEYYNLNLESDDLGVISTRHQGNFFPSVHLSYQVSDNREVTFSFVNRIQRPGYLILAPYFYFFDQNTLFTGNPAILPSRANQFQLGFSASNLSTQLQFTRERMPVFDAQPTLDLYRELFVVKPVQGGFNNVVSLNINYALEITRWWMSRLNLLGAALRQDLQINDVTYNKSSFNYEITTTQTWTINRIADIEITAGYYAPIYSGVIRTAARKQVDFGIRRTMRSGIAVSLNVSDVFNTGTQWPTVADVERAGIFYKFHFDAEGPVFRLSFSMPLGNRNIKLRDRRTGGSEEEQKRLK